jgi:hypothetical protein
MDRGQIEKKLCETFCADIRLHPVQGKRDVFFLETPFMFADGDSFTLYLMEIPYGFRITDFAHTFMHLSYENDTDALRTGTRGKLLEQILSEFDIVEKDGELYIDVPSEKLSSGLFRMGQGITRITDLTFLNRAHTENTFYEDLFDAIIRIVPNEFVTPDYNVPNIANAASYPVDYRVKGRNGDLFIFGVPNREKAKLTTICLQQYDLNHVPYDSLIVFEDQTKIHRGDLSRLTNVAGDQISSLDAFNEMKKKIGRKGEILTFPALSPSIS